MMNGRWGRGANVAIFVACRWEKAMIIEGMTQGIRDEMLIEGGFGVGHVSRWGMAPGGSWEIWRVELPDYHSMNGGFGCLIIS